MFAAAEYSPLAQAVEHEARGQPVGDLPVRDLEIADGDAGARAEPPVCSQPDDENTSAMIK
jgi:hypothetical protein